MLDAGSPGGPVDHGVQAGARLSEACMIVRRGLTGLLQLDRFKYSNPSP